MNGVIDKSITNMKTFIIKTDSETYIVEGANQADVASAFVREYYPQVLDDDLSNLYEIEECTHDEMIDVGDADHSILTCTQCGK